MCFKVGEEYVDVERHNARRFTQTLQNFVPSLLTLRSSIEVDEALQEFSAKYCQGLCEIPSLIQGSISLWCTLKLVHLGCDAVQFGRQVLFQRDLLPPSSVLKVYVAGSPETFVCQTT